MDGTQVTEQGARVSELEEENAALKARIAQLEADSAHKTEENEALKARIAQHFIGVPAWGSARDAKSSLSAETPTPRPASSPASRPRSAHRAAAKTSPPQRPSTAGCLRQPAGAASVQRKHAATIVACERRDFLRDVNKVPGARARFRRAPQSVRADRGCVLAAVQEDGSAIEFAPDAMKREPLVAMVACADYGRAKKVSRPSHEVKQGLSAVCCGKKGRGAQNCR